MFLDQNVTGHHSANGNKPFLRHNSVTWHFRKYKVFFFWILSSRWTICHHFQENWSNLSFSPLYNLNTNLWPFTTPNVRTTCGIWKNNYIFGILESRPTMWHTFKQNSSTFNFWPPYNPMRSFWSPIFQNAQWCQSGISLFVCQDMSKSQKQQKYCNYTGLPSSKFILLFVNSTMYAKSTTSNETKF